MFKLIRVRKFKNLKRLLKSCFLLNKISKVVPVILLTFSTSAKDVTAIVKSTTDLDEKIAKACSSSCGNRGVSTLQNIDVSPNGNGLYNVVANAKMQYHQYQDPPKVFGTRVGGGITILKYTINITAYGILNPIDCNLKIVNININGDRAGIAQSAHREEGKIYHLDNCQKFL